MSRGGRVARSRSATFGSWRLTYRRFDGTVATGRLIVHRDVARDVVGAFRNLYAADFPVRRMVPIDAYGASDFRSIEAHNTTAFNCRFVDGTTRWSEHAYGRAIDVNPVENPYVSGGRTSHPVSRPYVERSRRRPGMAYDGGALVHAFDAIGWGLGRALDVGEGLPALLGDRALGRSRASPSTWVAVPGDDREVEEAGGGPRGSRRGSRLVARRHEVSGHPRARPPTRTQRPTAWPS